MQYKFTDLIGEVRVALDQNTHELRLLASDENTLELDDIIRQKLLMSAKWLLERAPLDMIDTHKELVTSDTSTDAAGYLRLTLPSDYLRLYTIKVDSWDVAVFVAHEPDSEVAMMAKSEFAGITGNGRRPMAVFSPAHDSIECYGSTGKVEQARYIGSPKLHDNLLEFPERLHDALVLLSLAMVCDAYKEHDRGGVFRAQAIESAHLQLSQEKKSR